MNSRYSRYYTYIKPILKNRVVKNYSFLIFSLITSAIFAIFALQPTIRTILVLQQTDVEQKQLYEQVKVKANDLALATKNLQSIDVKTKDKLLVLLPYSSQLPSVINQINNLVKTNQASVSGLQFQPTDLEPLPPLLNKDATITNVDFTLNIIGSYNQLVNILNNLTKLDRLITIKSVNFNRGVEGGLLMSVNGRVYYFKQ